MKISKHYWTKAALNKYWGIYNTLKKDTVIHKNCSFEYFMTYIADEIS